MLARVSCSNDRVCRTVAVALVWKGWRRELERRAEARLRVQVVLKRHEVAEERRRTHFVRNRRWDPALHVRENVVQHVRVQYSYTH